MANELTRIINNRDSLRAAVASGVLQCSIDSQSTTFANMDDLRAVLNDFNRQIAVIAGVAERKPQYSTMVMRRGT